MNKFIKIFIYSFFIFSFLTIAQLVENKIAIPDFNYSIIVETGSYEEIQTFATENDIDIYQEYSIYLSRTTPYYYNLNGGEFYHEAPIYHNTINKDAYYLNVNEAQLKQVTTFLAENDITYSINGPIVPNYPGLRFSNFIFIILSIILLAIFIKYRVYKQKDLIYLKKINGLSDYEIFNQLEKPFKKIIIAIIITLIYFTITNGYLSNFIIISTLIIASCLFILDFGCYKLASYKKAKISFLLIMACFILIPFLFYYSLAGLPSYINQAKKWSFYHQTYDTYNEYYYVSGGVSTNGENTESPDLFDAASAQNQAYYINFGTYNAPFGSEVSEEYLEININEDFLNELGYTNVTNFYIPEGIDVPIPDDATVTYYNENIKMFKTNPIITTYNSESLPFFIDDEFDYEAYQSNGAYAYYVYPADTYFHLHTVKLILISIEKILSILTVILLTIIVLYIYTSHFVDKKRKIITVQLISGVPKIIAYKDLFINFGAIFFASVSIYLYILLSIIKNIGFNFYLGGLLFMVIPFILAISIILSTVFANKKINKIIGELWLKLKIYTKNMEKSK